MTKISKYKYHELSSLKQKHIFKPINWFEKFRKVMDGEFVKSLCLNYDDLKEIVQISIFEKGVNNNIFNYYNDEKEAVKISCERLLEMIEKVKKITEDKLEKINKN